MFEQLLKHADWELVYENEAQCTCRVAGRGVVIEWCSHWSVTSGFVRLQDPVGSSHHAVLPSNDIMDVLNNMGIDVPWKPYENPDRIISLLVDNLDEVKKYLSDPKSIVREHQQRLQSVENTENWLSELHSQGKVSGKFDFVHTKAILQQAIARLRG